MNMLQEQYNHILHMFGQNNLQGIAEGSSSSTSTPRSSTSHPSANLAQDTYSSTGNNATSLTISTTNSGWIIDSGATNHMTPHSDLLVNYILYQLRHLEVYNFLMGILH